MTHPFHFQIIYIKVLHIFFQTSQAIQKRTFVKMDRDSALLEVKISPGDEARLNLKLRNAFMRKYRTDNPNLFDHRENKTIFEKILRTKNSSDDIRWCIRNGADLYSVS